MISPRLRVSAGPNLECRPRSTTETKPAPPPVEKMKIKIDGREIEVPKMMPDWQGKLQPTTMLQACAVGRFRRAALLLSSETSHRRKLPHVPRGIRHARHGTGSQASHERRRLAQDCQIRFALRTDIAARCDCLRHADFAGHGNLSKFARDQANARRRFGIAAHQSSARLPDLRPGRRMQVAGIFRRSRQGQEQFCRSKSSQAQARRSRAAHCAR